MFKSFLTMPLHGTSSKYGIPSDHILRWHLVEHSPSILNAPTLLHTCPPSYSPQWHQTPNHFEWSADEHTCPLQSQPCWLMLSTPPTKVTEFGHTPSSCICWNLAIFLNKILNYGYWKSQKLLILALSIF
jgi:hypothetical protein